MNSENSSIARFVKVKKKDGQKLIKLIKTNSKKRRILNPRIQILYEEEYALFPLIEDNELVDPVLNSIRNQIEFSLENRIVTYNLKYKIPSLSECLKDLLI